MEEIELGVSALRALRECELRGLVVRSSRGLSVDPPGGHWHMGVPGRAGTLELTELQGRVWLKVHPLREAGWVLAFARELAQDLSNDKREPDANP